MDGIDCGQSSWKYWETEKVSWFRGEGMVEEIGKVENGFLGQGRREEFTFRNFLKFLKLFREEFYRNWNVQFIFGFGNYDSTEFRDLSDFFLPLINPI